MINNQTDEETEQMLIGSLLGDGGLQILNKGINANFKECHSAKQKEYLLWKKKYLNVFNAKIKEYKVFDKRTNKYYYQILLWTRTHPLLTRYFRLLYKKNKKSLNKRVLEKIGPLALAVWYCDDGSFGYINQNGKIATYLPYEDNVLIVKFLKEKFNINCAINKDGNKYHIYFNVKEIRKFLNLIKDYVPECMNYKLGPLKEENTKRLDEENLKRRERDKTRHQRDMKDPIKHQRIIRQKRENRREKLKNPEYRKKHNEYHKLWQREYRKNNREKYNEYSRIKNKEYYRKRKKQSRLL